MFCNKRKAGSMTSKGLDKFKLWIVLIALNAVICLVLDVLLMVQLVGNWNWLHELNREVNNGVNGDASCSMPKYVAALNFNFVYCTCFFTMYCLLDIVKSILLWPALMQKRLSECWCALQFFAFFLLVGQGLFSICFLPEGERRLMAFGLFVLLWTAILLIIVVWHNWEECWQHENPAKATSRTSAAVPKDPEEVQDAGSNQGSDRLEVVNSESDVPPSEPSSPVVSSEGKETSEIGGSLDKERATPDIMDEEVPLNAVSGPREPLKVKSLHPLTTTNERANHHVNAKNQSFELKPQQTREKFFQDAENQQKVPNDEELSKGGEAEAAIKNDTTKNQADDQVLPDVTLQKNEGQGLTRAVVAPTLSSPIASPLNEERLRKTA